MSENSIVLHQTGLNSAGLEHRVSKRSVRRDFEQYTQTGHCRRKGTFDAYLKGPTSAETHGSHWGIFRKIRMRFVKDNRRAPKTNPAVS